MDASLMKFLEDDEDESMHSGADVEALTAALNRDIGGDAPITPQPSEPDSGSVVSQGNNSEPNQQKSTQVEQVEQPLQSKQPHSDHQNIQTETIISQFGEKDQNPSQYPTPDRLQHSGGQQQHQMQQLNTNDANSSMKRTRASSSIPFHMLIPILLPHLDKDKSMQLQAVFTKLRTNEVSKEDFLRVIKNIVGDQMLRQAAQKVQMKIQAQAARNPPTNPNQYSLQSQAASLSSHGAQKSQEIENKSDGKGMNTTQAYSTNTNMVNLERESSTMALQTANKQQPSFPMYGGTAGNFYHAYPRPLVGASGTSLKPQNQGMASTHLGTTQPMNVPRYENQITSGENKRLSQSTAHVKQEVVDHSGEPSQKFQFGSVHVEQGNPNLVSLKDDVLEKQSSRMGFSASTSATGAIQISSSVDTQADKLLQMRSQIPSSTPSRTPVKKPTVGQKKPLEALGTSPPLPSKKQKTSGAFLDQSIEHLNDVTAVSGVNLREEEEQLLSAPKEDSRASEATRRVVQEEEEKMILQKGPLQKKLADIMSKCGLESTGSDVERCLSMCVEERLRGLISHVMRLSKQRIDVEKTKHRFVITSDVNRQILTMNRQAKEEWDKKQTEEAEKLRKLNDSEGTIVGADPEKQKDEGRTKNIKVNKEEDDKMRTNAANVAARAAVGGDDVYSKWLMVAQQKREGLDGPSGSQPIKAANNKSLPSFGRGSRGQQELEKRGSSSAAVGVMRKPGRSPAIMHHPKVACNATVKDVIRVLEREPQMSKSTLIYRLYNRIASDSATE